MTVRTFTFTLDHSAFAGRTGRAVRVAVIDSGIQPMHPHVGGALAGVRITDTGEDRDTGDRIGHGTAVAAAIREKAPGVELVPIRVFDHTLDTTADILARAIRAATARGARLINVSMGTTNAAHAELLRDAVEEAVRGGVVVIAPRAADGLPSWPGALETVAGAIADAACARDAMRIVEHDDATVTFHCSGLPRPIPDVPPARNLHGASFAAANVTGFLARLLEGEPTLRSMHDVVRHLCVPASPREGTAR